MSDYLFIFTTTPVQSFISQARKTRDLYAGSQILSEITKEAIKISIKYGAEIIMPYFEDIDKLESIPNRFLAKFPDVEEENLEAIGKNIENNTFLYWKNEIALRTLSNLFKNQNKEFFKKFNEHITKFFNFYWLFFPLEHNYQQSFNDSQSGLGAIKKNRFFEQFDLPENYRKCSICGERDAIVYKSKGLPAYSWDKSLAINPETIMLDENEGLCGICLIKRFYKNEQGKEYFPSTAKISLLNLWNNKKIEDKIVRYKNNFGSNFNEQFLFEENLRKSYLIKTGVDINKINIEKVKKELADIYGLAKKENSSISRYYALIKFDGDNMGKWVSGEFLEEKNKLIDFHQSLSEKLRKYAESSKKYLDSDGKGKTVYAGGDDFLGFINLVYLFEVLERLREEFDEKVNKPLKDKFTLEKDLTFSAGIVIAHYKDPLSLVLDWANKMEKEAKNLDNKNAFGIAVLKHSGEIRKAVYKWDKLQYIKEIYKSIVENEEFNSSFITKLEEGFKKIPIEYKEFYEKKGRDLIKADLKRILKKSSNIKNKNELNIKIKSLIVILSKLIYRETKNFFEFLNILKFIEKEL